MFSTDTTDAWVTSESGFDTRDQTRLFYRSWLPRVPRPRAQGQADGGPRTFIFLHRGHEHSGRIAALVQELGYHGDNAFAWDARGHGHSPGERGDAPGFATLVQDFDDFVHHLQARHGIDLHHTVVVANSVGAVLAAAWLHDYAPAVRGVVMAAAAFEINLYVPLAKPALRLAMGFNKDLFVTSYIRAGMLTHDSAQAQAYDADPLITKNISARVLLELADTAQRVVHDASAIDTPILMLVADQDYVVKQGPQRRFFARLSSPLKRMVLLRQCRHAIFYESDAVREQALGEARDFIEACFAQPLPSPTRWHAAHIGSASAQRYQALLRDEIAWPLRAFYAVQRALLGTLGRTSQGMRIGLEHGFDSGASLDYVYENRPRGDWLVGAVVDAGYLGAVGWRGIRLRRWHMQQALSWCIAQHPPTQPLRILDIATGGGRYVLETVKRFQQHDIHLTLRDFVQTNLDKARALADALQLNNAPELQLRDAFDAASYTDEAAQYDVVIISGLYELFNDNTTVLRSLQGVARQLKPGGYVVYTGQPWHPQLELIAKTLRNHQGQPWVMRPRPQAELDALVASIGCRKVHTQIGLEGIFTVSVARYVPALGKE